MSNLASPTSRPRFVNAAMLIAVAVSLAGVVNMFLFMPSLMAYMQAQGLQAEALSSGVMYGAAIGSAVLTVVFCFFIARASNVARWIWAVFTAYGALSALGSISATFAISVLFGVVGMVLQMLAVASVVLLFMPVSNAWFKTVKQAKAAS